MNKLKSLFIASLLIMSAGIAKADLISGQSGWNFTHFADSGSLTTEAVEIGAIYMSSGISTQADYGILFSTNATSSVLFGALPAAGRVSPALIFNSTTTLTGDQLAPAMDRVWNAIGPDGNGIRLNNGAYWFASAGASGEARRAVIKWRRGKSGN